MRKLLVLLLIATALVYASSCSDHTQPPSKPAPKEVIDTGKMDVEGPEGLLFLHPVLNSASGENNKKFYFFYDYFNEYLHVTDDEAIYPIARDSLPEYINRNNVGRAVILEAVAAHPFSNFTDETSKKIALSEGIEFGKINQYQIAKDFNANTDKRSKKALRFMLNILKGISPGHPATPTGRLAVTGTEGMLTRHPVRNEIKGNDNVTYYFFYDRKHHWIYITDDVDLYKKFSDALPVDISIQNAVLVQGVAIDPFVFFSKETIEKMTKEEGLEINGGKNANEDLNQYKVAKISNYGIVIDYPSVISEIEGGSTTRSSEPAVNVQKQGPPAPAKTNQEQPDWRKHRATGEPRQKPKRDIDTTENVVPTYDNK